MQRVSVVVLDPVDAQDVLAARGSAVGDHVDGLGVLARVKDHGRAREALPLTLPDDMVALDGPRDRPDDLPGRLRPFAAKGDGDPGPLLPVQLFLGGILSTDRARARAESERAAR